MKHYAVSFYVETTDESGKKKKGEWSRPVEVNDHGVGQSLTLAGKAFRQVSDRFSMAKKISITEIRKA